MADFPTHVYLRPPLFDGDLVAGGGLTSAVKRLSELRAEVVAIETALGVQLKGAAASLAARLAVRLSRNGIPRGQPFVAPTGLWYDGTTWVASGQVTKTSGGPTFDLINFGFTYLSADRPKAVFTAAKTAHATDKCGWALTGRILTTGFYVSMGRRNSSFNSTLPEDITVNWFAVGGTPA